MKKIIALLMAVLMTVGMLAACSNTPAETNPPADETKGQVDTLKLLTPLLKKKRLL